MLKFILALWRSRGVTLVLSLLLIMMSLYYGLVFELQQEVNAELRSVASRGERVELSQLQPAPVPPQSNAAPYYQAAIDLNTVDPPVTDFRDADVTQVEAALTEHPQEMASYLQDLRPTLDLLALGYGKPECVYPYHIEEGYRMRVLSYLNMRRLFWMVELQALLDLHQNHPQQAVAACTWALSFLSRFHYGDMMVEQMIKVVGGNLILTPLEKLADQGVRGDYGALLKELDAAQRDADGSMPRTIEAERAMSVDFYRRLGDDPEAVRDVAGPEEQRGIMVLYRLGGRPLLLWDELRFLRTLDRFEQGLREKNPSLLVYRYSDSFPARYLPSNLMLPCMDRAAERIDQYRERLQKLSSRLQALND